MKKIIFPLLITSAIFCACGPSADEIKQKEIILQDSLDKVKQEHDTLVIKQKIQTDSLAKTDNIAEKKLKYQLIKLNTTYQEECNKLEKIKGHKLLRSKHKKEEQIQKQILIVEGLKNQIANLKKQIGN